MRPALSTARVCCDMWHYLHVSIRYGLKAVHVDHCKTRAQLVRDRLRCHWLRFERFRLLGRCVKCLRLAGYTSQQRDGGDRQRQVDSQEHEEEEPYAAIGRDAVTHKHDVVDD